MGRRTRTGAARAVVLGVAAVLLTGGAAAGVPASGPATPVVQARDQDEPHYRFLSSPDFLNTDLADLRGVPGFEEGDPNSWDPAWETALDVVLDRFASEQPDDVLVPGDLVNGHWGYGPLFHHAGLPADYDYGVFDSVRDEKSARAAVRLAARTYYGQWTQRFAERDLPVHVAVGDHELGDDPWTARGDRYVAFKHRNLGLFRSQFATHALHPERYGRHPEGPASRTAYATRLAPDVLLVTLDVFRKTAEGVRIEPDPQQLAWLEKVLTRARRDGVRWTVVQAHTPVVGPVRVYASSALTVRGGRSSQLWRTLRSHDVDLFLTGEVHDVTAVRRDGVLQVSHGGLVASGGVDGRRGSTSYLVGDVYDDRLELRVERFVVTNGSEERLWQPSPHSRPRAVRVFDPETVRVGSLTLDADGTVRDREGLLAPYQPDGS